jgi:hypothetical protein
MAILRELEGGSKNGSAAYLQKGTTPVIDGKMDEPFWGKVQPLNVNQLKDDGEPVKVSTTAKIAYDTDYLYIAVRCEEPLMNKITDVCSTHDGPVWTENDLEFFFDIANGQKGFKQILINSLGTITDVELINGENDMKWESKAQVMVAKEANAWTMEMRVPFKTLSGTIPKPGAIWGFNVCRVRAAVKPMEYICWNPTFGRFASPERFGKLIFR